MGSGLRRNDPVGIEGAVLVAREPHQDWHRDWKDRLIEENNPTWWDLLHELGL